MATDPNKEKEYKPSAATLAGHDASGTVGLPKQGTKPGSGPKEAGGPHTDEAQDSDEDQDEDEG